MIFVPKRQRSLEENNKKISILFDAHMFVDAFHFPDTHINAAGVDISANSLKYWESTSHVYCFKDTWLADKIYDPTNGGFRRK